MNGLSMNVAWSGSSPGSGVILPLAIAISI